MSEKIVRFAKIQKTAERLKTAPPPLPSEERKALHALRCEARDHGITLADRIHEALPPSITLHVMRRDRFQCHIHRDMCTGPMHVASKYPAKFVWHHQNDPVNLITVCKVGTDAAQHQRPKDQDQAGKDVRQVERLASVLRLRE